MIQGEKNINRATFPLTPLFRVYQGAQFAKPPFLATVPPALSLSYISTSQMINRLELMEPIHQVFARKHSVCFQ